MQDTTLAPDLAQAAQLLAAIDPTPGATFGFRAIGEAPDGFRGGVLAFGTLDHGTRQASDPAKHGRPCRPGKLMTFMQTRGAGVFVVPNKLDGHGQREENVLAIRTVFADCDTRQSVEWTAALIARTGLVPAITVASGGEHEGVSKLHHYWRVTGCPLDRFRDLARLAISRTGSDPACCDRSRVLRLPGFYHQKGTPRTPRMSRIVAQSDAAYAFSDLMSRFAGQPQVCAMPAPSRQAGVRGAPASSPASAQAARLRYHLDRHGALIVPAVKAAVTEAVHGERHLMLRAIVARLVPLQWPDADVLALIEPAALAAWPDVAPLELRARLDHILAWTREREAAKVPATAPTAAMQQLARAFGARA